MTAVSTPLTDPPTPAAGSAPWWRDRRVWRDLAVLILAAWAARLIALWILPATAYSVDLDTWTKLASRLDRGQNVYAETTRLNWPPLWLQLIWIFQRIHLATGIAYINVVRGFLMLGDAVALAVCYGFFRSLRPGGRLFWPLLLGLALNPVFILLSTQHGNFDVLVLLEIMGAVGMTIRFQRSEDPTDWVWACVFVGLGILTKTVPFMLIPLLFIQIRRVPWSTRLLGALLVLGPVTLGMSIIYVLNPQEITDHVLRYRSFPGKFGVTGLLQLAGFGSADVLATDASHGLAGWYVRLFSPLVLLSIVVLSVLASRWRRPTPLRILVATATLFTFVVTLGPGYSTQYIYWFAPPFIIAAAIDRRLRAIVIAWLAVTALTFIVYYAVSLPHGAYLWHMRDRPFMLAVYRDYAMDPSLRPIVDRYQELAADPAADPAELAAYRDRVHGLRDRWLYDDVTGPASTNAGQTLFLAPVFVMQLLLLLAALRIFRAEPRDDDDPTDEADAADPATATAPPAPEPSPKA